MSTDDLLARLARVSTTSLADAGAGLRVPDAGIRPLRSGRRLLGRAVTADAQGDLVPVVAALAAAGPGDVLVVASGSAGHAVAGELFGTEAVRRGVVGLVVDGLVRDTATLATLDLTVYARGAAPHACPARGPARTGTPVLLGGVEVRPGDLVLGDDDGLVVLDEAEAGAAVEAAEGIEAREAALRRLLEEGASLLDHVDLDAHLARLGRGEPSRLGFS